MTWKMLLYLKVQWKGSAVEDFPQGFRSDRISPQIVLETVSLQSWKYVQIFLDNAVYLPYEESLTKKLLVSIK